MKCSNIAEIKQNSCFETNLKFKDAIDSIVSLFKDAIVSLNFKLATL